MKTYSSVQYTPTARASLLGARPAFKGLPSLPPSQVSSLYLQGVRALAWSVAEKRARKDARAVDLRAELAREAESAAGEACAVMFARFASFAPNAFPCLAQRLAKQKAEGAHLALAFPLIVWRAAHKACDRALRKMARESATEDVARIFDATGWADEANAEDCKEVRTAEDMACAAIRIKSEKLRALIRERADAGNGNARRAAIAHLARVDKWEARALALARGEDSAPLAVLSTKAETVREVSERLTVRTASGRLAAHDGRGTASGSRTRKDKEGWALLNRGFEELRKLSAFIGQPVASV